MLCGLMHRNPYGEYAVLLAASLANNFPVDGEGILERSREFGLTMDFTRLLDDHAEVRRVIDDWLTVIDAPDHPSRAALLNAQMTAASTYPRLTDHDQDGWHLHYRDEHQTLPHAWSAAIIARHFAGTVPVPQVVARTLCRHSPPPKPSQR